jgi:hypothetical protein
MHIQVKKIDEKPLRAGTCACPNIIGVAPV